MNLGLTLSVMALFGCCVLTSARKQCTVFNGKCFYHVTLKTSDCSDERSDDVTTITDAKLTQLEASVSQRQIEMDKKLADLERQLSFLLGQESVRSVADDPRQADTGQQESSSWRPANDAGHREHGLLSEISDGFASLRSEVALRTRQVRSLQQQVRMTQSTLNRTRSELAATERKLTDTELSLQKTVDDNAALKRTLIQTEEDLASSRRDWITTTQELEETSEALDITLKERDGHKAASESCLRELHTTREDLNEVETNYKNLMVDFKNVSSELKRTATDLKACRKSMPRFCSFEDPILCGFQQDKTDGEIDWIVWREATPSALTGPPSDHTCGNERGSYVYVEATAKDRGQRARLLSQRMFGQGEQCLQFWYHMYGHHVGTLNVYTMVNGEADEDTPKWRAYGNQGNVWSTARLRVPAEVAIAGYTVCFEVILERGYQGDIAIDDFSISDGLC
ncbi:hypothetical protein CAPTEDRAFT_206663 [Capitella teleta]|uniref:MAM domain-containing protein n=1 Tax=Capitella teleta TaxID=283909 RepID=R7UD85_CAPTE|nr:hypothetical protein CAPTEDRAFT_206663 [Capitella teleta]|eukprot:ELU04061.1 hypothetical protein CAPTEDRAFT_206663 [Capitella teleta]